MHMATKDNIDFGKMLLFFKKYNKKLVITVNGNSMYPSLKEGDKVQIDFEREIHKMGDIILFESKGGYILHRIVKCFDDNTYITKGDNNYLVDEVIVSINMIVGSIDTTMNKTWKIFTGAKMSYIQSIIFFQHMRIKCKVISWTLYRLCVIFRFIYNDLLKVCN